MIVSELPTVETHQLQSASFQDRFYVSHNEGSGILDFPSALPSEGYFTDNGATLKSLLRFGNSMSTQHPMVVALSCVVEVREVRCRA